MGGIIGLFCKSVKTKQGVIHLRSSFHLRQSFGGQVGGQEWKDRRQRPAVRG